MADSDSTVLYIVDSAKLDSAEFIDNLKLDSVKKMYSFIQTRTILEHDFPIISSNLFLRFKKRYHIGHMYQ